jgi:hypothetical protein
MNKLSYYLFPVLWVCQAPVAMADNIATSALEKAVDAGFSELERDLIGKYYQGHQTSKSDNDEDRTTKTKSKKSKKGLPPGLANKDELPPGLAKQLQKNGTLPPGLAKRSLPGDLERRLPPPPKGYERQIIEDATVVLVDMATGKIADIIYDVITGK